MSIDRNDHCIWQWQTTTHSTTFYYPSSTLLLHIHTYTHTHNTHFSIPSNRSFWWRAAPRRSVPVLSSHSSFFPPRYTLSGRISSSFLFLQRASSSRLFFIEFLPTTAGRRDYLWPLETIEERWKHTRIHFRIHPPRIPPSPWKEIRRPLWRRTPVHRGWSIIEATTRTGCNTIYIYI